MNFCYYIVDGVVSSENQGLPGGVRILKMPTTFPIIKLARGEGPFYDIPSLKKNSILFKNTPSIRKEKILKEKNIVSVADKIMVPKNESYTFDYIKFFLHITKGDLSKGTYNGYHLFNENRCRVVEVINEYPNGVWEAMIEILDVSSNTWYGKKRSSTFFPKGWTLQKLFEEIQYCIKNKIHIADGQYESYTRCGIKVEMFYKNGNIKTLYPII